MRLLISFPAHSNHEFQGDIRKKHPYGYLIAKRYHTSKARNVSRVRELSSQNPFPPQGVFGKKQLDTVVLHGNKYHEE